MFGLSLIAVLAVMGGLIAYIGDKIGTRVGKKKLSIFGLRPKYTSIIVAVATGILITASTLVMLTISSRSVRTALFGMEKLRAERSVLSTEVAQKTAEVAQKNQQLEENQALLKDKEQEYAVLTQRVAESQKQLAKLETELSGAIAQRDRTMAELARTQADYDTARGDLAKAKGDIAALEKTKSDLDSKINDLSVARDKLQKEVDSLTVATNEMRTDIQNFRGGKVLFRTGELLATASMHAGGDGLQSGLGKMIVQTNYRVLARMGISDPQVDMLRFSADDYQTALKTLQNSGQDMVVRIVANGNSVQNEYVWAHFELYPDKRVFDRGEEVYKTTVNLEQGKIDYNLIVMNFLQQVNYAATAKGVLPADPLLGTISSVSAEEFYNTANQLEKLGGVVEISAVAVDDISVAGPLRIRMVVRRAK